MWTGPSGLGVGEALDVTAVAGDEQVPAESKSDNVLDQPIESLDLGGRILNMLRNAGIVTVRDLVSRGDDDLLRITNFGKKALAEVRENLETSGLGLGMRFDLPRG